MLEPWSHITSKTNLSPLIKFFSNSDTEAHLQNLAEELGTFFSSVYIKPSERGYGFKNKLDNDSSDSKSEDFCTNFG